MFWLLLTKYNNYERISEGYVKYYSRNFIKNYELSG